MGQKVQSYRVKKGLPRKGRGAGVWVLDAEAKDQVSMALESHGMLRGLHGILQGMRS